MLKKKKKPSSTEKNIKKTDNKEEKNIKNNANNKAVKEKKKKDKVANGNIFSKIGNYFKELKSEMKKVVWPTEKDVLVGFFVVVAMVAAVTVYVIFSDFLFHNLFKIFIDSFKS